VDRSQQLVLYPAIKGQVFRNSGSKISVGRRLNSFQASRIHYRSDCFFLEKLPFRKSISTGLSLGLTWMHASQLSNDERRRNSSMPLAWKPGLYTTLRMNGRKAFQFAISFCSLRPQFARGGRIYCPLVL